MLSSCAGVTEKRVWSLGGVDYLRQRGREILETWILVSDLHSCNLVDRADYGGRRYSGRHGGFWKCAGTVGSLFAGDLMDGKGSG